MSVNVCSYQNCKRELLAFVIMPKPISHLNPFSYNRMWTQETWQLPSGSLMAFWLTALMPVLCLTRTLKFSTIWHSMPQPVKQLVCSILFVDWQLQILAEVVVKLLLLSNKLSTTPRYTYWTHYYVLVISWFCRILIECYM